MKITFNATPSRPKPHWARVLLLGTLLTFGFGKEGIAIKAAQVQQAAVQQNKLDLKTSEGQAAHKANELYKQAFKDFNSAVAILNKKEPTAEDFHKAEQHIKSAQKHIKQAIPEAEKSGFIDLKKNTRDLDEAMTHMETYGYLKYIALVKEMITETGELILKDLNALKQSAEQKAQAFIHNLQVKSITKETMEHVQNAVIAVSATYNILKDATKQGASNLKKPFQGYMDGIHSALIHRTRGF